MFQWTLNDSGEEVVVTLAGNFSFDAHDSARQMIEAAQNTEKKRFVLDMARVQTLDSAALGMLLLLRDRVGGRSATIRLRGATGAVAAVLQMANFQRYFTVG